MGTETNLKLDSEMQLHVDIMRAVAKDFQDIPMVLKGATAKLAAIMLDVNEVEKRFEYAFEEDDILQSDALPATILQITEFLTSRA